MNVRFPAAQLAQLDAAIARELAPKPTKPELLRRALADWLKAKGKAR